MSFTQRFAYCASLLLALGCATTASAAAPPTPTPGLVRRLIEQLGEDDFDRREEAIRALRSYGPRVLPTIRQAMGHPDVEVRMRLKRILAPYEGAQLHLRRRGATFVLDKTLP